MPGVKISELPSATLLDNNDYLALARPGAGGGTTYKILGSVFGRQTDVLSLSSNKVSKSGDTMTGKLVLDGAPTLDLHAATKLYVDQQTASLSNKVSKTGDTMSGMLTLYAAPTENLHAATKKYVDDKIAEVLVALGAKNQWSEFECS